VVAPAIAAGVDAEIVWGDLADDVALKRPVDGADTGCPCRRPD
jgi:hypothetical protein